MILMRTLIQIACFTLLLRPSVAQWLWGVESPWRSEINEGLVTTLADRLKLTEDQRAAVALRFQTHQASFDKFVATEHPAKEGFESRLAELDQQTAEFDLLLIESKKSLAKSAERQESLDQAFWSDLRKLLNNDAQVAEWDRIMLERDRARFKRLMTLVPGLQVDVVQIVSDMNWPQHVQDAIAPFLVQYIVERDALIRNILHEEVRDSREQAVKQAERNYERQQAYRDLRDAGLPFDHSPIAEEVTRRESRDQQAHLRTLRTMTTLNQRYVETIVAQIPEDLKPLFREAVQHASYPMVYWRDPKLDRVFSAVQALEDIDEDQRMAVERLNASYEIELQQSQRAQAEAVDEHFSVRVGHPSKWLERVETSDAFQALDEQRRALDGRTLDALLSLLTDEQRRLVTGDEATEAVK